MYNQIMHTTEPIVIILNGLNQKLRMISTKILQTEGQWCQCFNFILEVILWLHINYLFTKVVMGAGVGGKCNV